MPLAIVKVRFLAGRLCWGVIIGGVPGPLNWGERLGPRASFPCLGGVEALAYGSAGETRETGLRPPPADPTAAASPAPCPPPLLLEGGGVPAVDPAPSLTFLAMGQMWPFFSWPHLLHL